VKGRKVFFSEEKKQKTFILRSWPKGKCAGNKSFLVLFFKKERSWLSMLSSNHLKNATFVLGSLDMLFQAAADTVAAFAVFSYGQVLQSRCSRLRQQVLALTSDKNGGALGHRQVMV
jgi:hypothetical protein